MLNSFHCPINLTALGFEMSIRLNLSLPQTETAAPPPTVSTAASSALLPQKACGMCMTRKRRMIKSALSEAEQEADWAQLTLEMKVCGDKNQSAFLTDSPGYTSHSGHPRHPHSRRSSSTGHTGPLSPSASACSKASSHM